MITGSGGYGRPATSVAAPADVSSVRWMGQQSNPSREQTVDGADGAADCGGKWRGGEHGAQNGPRVRTTDFVHDVQSVTRIQRDSCAMQGDCVMCVDGLRTAVGCPGTPGARRP